MEKKEQQRKVRYTVDSFCDEIARSFLERVGKGAQYSGLYLYSSDGLTQQDLNLFRQRVLDKIGNFDSNVIASSCGPENLQGYDARYPDAGGWLTVDIGYFIEKGNLVI